jgi:hypothetical protein
VTAQNEALTKRLDDLESRHSKKMKKSSSLKSFSTLNNTFCESEILEDFNNIPKSEEKKNIQNLNISDISGFLTSEMEWKKDIEKSIETLSEKVAANNSTVLVDLLEKRVNDMNSEFSKLKRSFEDSVDNASVIKRSIEKFDKTEKLITSLLSQMTEMRNNNIKWQADFLKNLNDFNEKILIQESTLEDLENFEKSVRKKIDSFNNEFKVIQHEFKIKLADLDYKHTDKSKVLSDEIQNLINENWKITEKVGQELTKIEGKKILKKILKKYLKINSLFTIYFIFLVSNKALWDSFALFSSSLDNQNINKIY